VTGWKLLDESEGVVTSVCEGVVTSVCEESDGTSGDDREVGVGVVTSRVASAKLTSRVSADEVGVVTTGVIEGDVLVGVAGSVVVVGVEVSSREEVCG